MKVNFLKRKPLKLLTKIFTILFNNFGYDINIIQPFLLCFAFQDDTWSHL